MSDTTLRTKIVDSFYESFGKKSTKSKGDIYTRIQSYSEPVTDRLSEEDTLDVMLRLYDKFIEEHGLEKTIKLAKTFW
jgi:hypothetical protein